MKPSSDLLFQLIHRMTKSEKRYFKLFATRNIKEKKNNYLKLFEAIEKQPAYDEARLKKQFKNSTFVKYFSTAKTQLKSQVLDALHEFHNGDPSEQIKKSVHQVRILLGKGFFEEARKLLKKTKQRACETGLLHLMPEMQFIEKESFSRFHNLNAGVLNELHTETLLTGRKIDQQSLSWHTVLSLFLVYENSVVLRREDDLKAIEATIRPLEKSEPDADNPVARIYYHRAMGQYHSMAGNAEKHFEHLEKAINLYQKNPALLETSMMLYATLYYNFLISCQQMQKIDLYAESIEKMETLIQHPKCNLLTAAHLFLYTSNARMHLHWVERDFDECLVVAKKMEQGIEQHQRLLSISRTLALYDTIVDVYFIQEMYDNALTWINSILDERKSTVRQDFISMARVKSIIIHFEMGNFLLIENLLLSSRRYMETRGKLFKAEKVLLSAFRKVINVGGKNERIIIFQHLKDQLHLLKDDPFERKVFSHFEFIEWADSKIEGVPFRKILERD